MKTILAVIIFSFLAVGCVAHVTPEGTYLEPLPVSVAVAPVVVAPPRHIVARPLPPVVVEPGRHVYLYNNLYYYYWNKSWYYGEKQRGPWHKLPGKYYPKHYRERGRGRGYR